MGHQRLSGSTLNERWGVGARHALYHKDGTWYNTLERFPGALFDPKGYVLFGTREEYESSPHLHIGIKINIKQGISSMPGYVRRA